MLNIRASRAALFSAAFLFLTACVPFEEQARQRVTQGEAAGFQSFSFGEGGRQLKILLRPAPGVLTVYIEGDGAPWPSLYQPPADPTPIRSSVLAMAFQAKGATAYLGRPCQYLDATLLQECPVVWWTQQRFAENLIVDMNAAINEIKARAGAARLQLVGYSGGGVAATLIASRRRDVDRLITVASPLDLQAWTSHHRVTPVEGKSAMANILKEDLPVAVHFAGADDKVVPPTVVESFARRTGGQFIQIRGFDHSCCWAEAWPDLLEKK